MQHTFQQVAKSNEWLKELQRFGFRTIVVTGKGNPEKNAEDVLSGIEALADTDLAIFFMRFLKLPNNEWQPIDDDYKLMKPVIGLRTANHSFKYPSGQPRFVWNDDFGRCEDFMAFVSDDDGQTWQGRLLLPELEEGTVSRCRETSLATASSNRHRRLDMQSFHGAGESRGSVSR